MASIQPYNGAFDFRQMWDFVDWRPKSSSKNPRYPSNTIMDIVSTNKDLSIITQIIQKARFKDQLSDNQANFTLFVPSDKYLKQKYSPKEIDDIDVGSARQILNYSLMNRRLDHHLLQSTPVSTYPTLNRSFPLQIINMSGKTYLPNKTQIIHWNIPASNGLIHVVDGLLYPTNCSAY